MPDDLEGLAETRARAVALGQWDVKDVAPVHQRSFPDPPA